ncbi:ABC transporter permease [Nakamurella endophytica]|uniref:ABC transporter permease n=1 Tax=Nakamurella endophytica TaxID=1748367 RepID=UPI0035710F84
MPTGLRPPAPLVLRILPFHLYARRSRVLLERSLRVYRRSWMVILSGFFEPVFYLLALGQGLGSLVGSVETAAGPVTYAAYIAPGLLATSAMNGAIYDATTNVFFKMRFAKLYDAMLATSLGPVDVALGEITWSLIRGGLYSVGFVVVMLAMGLVASWWALLAVPVALLIALGFAAVGMAVTSYVKTFQHLEWIQTAILPMFLFSTTFYPLGTYPRPVQLLVECLPLFHGIELMRGLCLGVGGPALLLHGLYFVAMAVVGLAVTARRLERLLLR